MDTLHLIYNYLFVQHPVITIMVFSNIVSLMPSPQPNSTWYKWFFGILHLAAQNIGRVVLRKDNINETKI